MKNYYIIFLCFFLSNIGNAQSSLFFDYAQNDYFTVSNPSFNDILDDSFTIESVIKIEKLIGKTQVIQHYYSTRYNLGFIKYINKNGQFVFQLNNDRFIVEKGLETNKCYHISVSRDRNLINIYINGILALQKETNQTNTTLEKQIHFYLGGNMNQDNFYGEIDEIRLFSDSSDQDVINNNLFTPLNTSVISNLEAYFNFDEDFTQTITDYSSNNNVGYLGTNELNETVDPKKIKANCIREQFEIEGVDFCGIIHYDIQPIESCPELTHFDLNGQHLEELKFYDRFGNVYCDATVPGAVNDNLYSNKNSENGNFILDYDDNIPQDFITVIDQVFSDLEQLIVFQPSRCGNVKKPRIVISNEPNGATSLASASGFYIFDGSNRMWNIINGAYNLGSNNVTVGSITINSNNIGQLFTGFATDVNMDGQMDQSTLQNLYHVILHEALHIFGFSATSIYLNIPGNTQRPSRYDHLLLHNGMPFLDGFPGMTYTTTDVFNDIALTTPCSNDFIGVHSNYTVFTPNPWDQGSSLSHFDDTDDCTGLTRVMGHLITPGQYTRISIDEINVLKDLGYTTTNTYGTQNLTISGTENPYYQIDNDYENDIVNVAHLDNGCYTNSIPVDQIPVINTCDDGPYFISTDFLLENDNFTGGVAIAAIEVANGFGMLITVPGGFNLISTFQGLEIEIKYITINAEGILSNVATFTVLSELCDAFEENFGCINTSSCNLICNSELISVQPCDFITFSAVSPNANGCPDGTASIPGWYGYTTSADYFGDVTIFPFPSTYHIPLGGFMQSSSSSNSETGEAVMTKVNDLQSETNYILSVFSHRRSNKNTTLNIKLANFSDSNYPDYLSNTTPQPTDFQNVLTQNLFTPDSGWKQSIQTFTTGVNNTYDILVFQSFLNTTFFDQVELIEDRLNSDNIITQLNDACGVQTLGTDLCDITGAQYTWDNITSGTAIPITMYDTNGNLVVTAAGNTLGITIDNANGSLISATISDDTIFRFNRTFVNSWVDDNEMEIVTNNADTTIDITVTCDNCISNWPVVYGDPVIYNSLLGNGIETDTEGNVYVISGMELEEQFPFIPLPDEFIDIRWIISKYDDCGNLVWIRPFHHEGHWGKIYIDNNDHIIATVYDHYIARVDNLTGDIIWENDITGLGNIDWDNNGKSKVTINKVTGDLYIFTEYQDITIIAQNGPFNFTTPNATATANFLGSKKTYGLLYKINPDGNLVWSKTLESDAVVEDLQPLTSGTTNYPSLIRTGGICISEENNTVYLSASVGNSIGPYFPSSGGTSEYLFLDANHDLTIDGNIINTFNGFSNILIGFNESDGSNTFVNEIAYYPKSILTDNAIAGNASDGFPRFNGDGHGLGDIEYNQIENKIYLYNTPYIDNTAQSHSRITEIFDNLGNLENSYIISNENSNAKRGFFKYSNSNNKMYFSRYGGVFSIDEFGINSSFQLTPMDHNYSSLLRDVSTNTAGKIYATGLYTGIEMHDTNTNLVLPDLGYNNSYFITRLLDDGITIITNNFITNGDEDIFQIEAKLLIIFPNPTASIFNIEFANKSISSFNVEIQNIQGITILNFKNKKEIDISALNTGVYFIKTTTDNGQIAINRIVKNQE